MPTGRTSIEIAASAEEGLRVLERNPGRISAAIVDLTMPGMDGETMARTMRERGVRIPTILMSGFSTHTAAREDRERNFDGYVSKPFRSEELLGEVRRVTSRKR